MRFYTQPHRFYWGSDRHARTMYVCILNREGEIVGHRNMKASPDALLKVMVPYRKELGVAVEWTLHVVLAGRPVCPGRDPVCPGPCPLHAGHARGQGHTRHKRCPHDCGAAPGGMRPHAYVDPAERRAPRDLVRRRMSLIRQRAALLTHVQQSNSQSNLPDIGTKLAYKANREEGAERFPDPAGPQRIKVDLAWLTSYDRLRTELERSLVNTAKAHNAQIFYRLCSIPGGGKILALVLLDEIHDIHRFPRVQAFVSSCRLVKGAKESAGKRYGTSGTKIGNAYLTWACSAAAVLCLRATPAGQKYLARLEKNHGQGQALTILAHKLARAVYDRWRRDTVFDLDKFLQ
jgi:hypothetical protein